MFILYQNFETSVNPFAEPSGVLVIRLCSLMTKCTIEDGQVAFPVKK